MYIGHLVTNALHLSVTFILDRGLTGYTYVSYQLVGYLAAIEVHIPAQVRLVFVVPCCSCNWDRVPVRGLIQGELKYGSMKANSRCVGGDDKTLITSTLLLVSLEARGDSC